MSLAPHLSDSLLHGPLAPLVLGVAAIVVAGLVWKLVKSLVTVVVIVAILGGAAYFLWRNGLVTL